VEATDDGDAHCGVRKEAWVRGGGDGRGVGEVGDGAMVLQSVVS
jgi:hypothetical protein